MLKFIIISFSTKTINIYLDLIKHIPFIFDPLVFSSAPFGRGELITLSLLVSTPTRWLNFSAVLNEIYLNLITIFFLFYISRSFFLPFLLYLIVLFRSFRVALITRHESLPEACQ